MQQVETYGPAPSYSPFSKRARHGTSTLWLADAVVTRWGMKHSRVLETDAADTTFAMLDEMVQHALQDATQSCDLDLRWEAVAWLWVCCPDIADQLLLTLPESLPEHVDLQQHATAYLARYPA